ncbi:hypothetical protein T265_01679 [Opisthorchis viverrini]|uniref:Uncharacterized protein n=1 Tax=Opisthorchis viverrini TaxID=6198 RepID=A0A075AIU6_OPIVI|nr:hypothetical protein T265_01679 [Opisthorchis viverrini]KER32249.1 hypothetical protein T265_01679 [Opisthorchis viverrini]
MNLTTHRRYRSVGHALDRQVNDLNWNSGIKEIEDSAKKEESASEGDEAEDEEDESAGNMPIEASSSHYNLNAAGNNKAE